MRPKSFPTTQATRRADPPSYAIRSWEPRCFGRGGHEESLSSDKEGGKYNKKKTDNKKLDKKETERTAPQRRRTRRTAGVWREPQPPKRTIPVTGRDRYSSVVTNTPPTPPMSFSGQNTLKGGQKCTMRNALMVSTSIAFEADRFF